MTKKKLMLRCPELKLDKAWVTSTPELRRVKHSCPEGHGKKISFQKIFNRKIFFFAERIEPLSFKKPTKNTIAQ